MDNLARKARVEREQQFDALTQKIIDSGWDMDRLYNIARHPEIKSRLFKTFGWTIELTDDCESMDVLWIRLLITNVVMKRRLHRWIFSSRNVLRTAQMNYKKKLINSMLFKNGFRMI